jgi:PAS domain S-box-containing protein
MHHGVLAFDRGVAPAGGAALTDDRAIASFPPVANEPPIRPATLQASFIAQLDGNKVLQLLSNTPDPQLIADVSGTIVFTNLQVETVFGYSPGDLLGAPVYTLIPERFRAGHSGHLRDFIEPPTTRPVGQKLELSALTRDGREVPVEISLSSIGDGEQRLVVTNIRDVTEYRRDHGELANLNRQLAQKTSQLESIVSDLRVFAQTASHDLQAPLRQISQFLTLLERRAGDRLDSDSQEYLRSAAQSAKRLSQMVRDILAYSRIGTSEERFQPLDLSALLGDVLMSMRTLLEENQAVVTQDALPLVHADAVQVTQLLQNLIANALVHRGEGAPHIHISGRVENGRCVVSVQDNGPGINARHHLKIFEMFQRPGVAPNLPGAGVGLAICKRIVERHEGFLGVESEPGKGARFFFTLPPHEPS